MLTIPTEMSCQGMRPIDRLSANSRSHFSTTNIKYVRKSHQISICSATNCISAPIAYLQQNLCIACYCSLGQARSHSSWKRGGSRRADGHGYPSGYVIDMKRGRRTHWSPFLNATSWKTFGLKRSQHTRSKGQDHRWKQCGCQLCRFSGDWKVT